MNTLIIAVGGALGSMARYGTGRLMLGFLGAAFPYGTLAVNLIGCLLMGIISGVFAFKEQSGQWQLFLATGIMGGFTTFSAFSLDAVLLWQRGQAGLAISYVLISVLGGLALLCAGLWLGRQLFGG